MSNSTVDRCKLHNYIILLTDITAFDLLVTCKCNFVTTLSDCCRSSVCRVRSKTW